MGRPADLDAARRLVSAEERRALEEAEAMRDEAARLLQRAEKAVQAWPDPPAPANELEEAKHVLELATGRIDEADALASALERLADRFGETLDGLDHLTAAHDRLGELQALIRARQAKSGDRAAAGDQLPDDGLLPR